MRGKLETKEEKVPNVYRFNEARALCAGSCGLREAPSAKGVASMRPAHYAREVALNKVLECSYGDASMRPAHYAREVAWRLRLGLLCIRFNEARALCAGSSVNLSNSFASSLLLQ